jgi:O-antigen/teichoic acid export membrane protein
MRSRVIWRRSATAIGTYVAAGLGFLATIVATRELGVHGYGRFAAVVAAVTFFQQLLDLTIEEALVKFGFRYTESGQWGRFRRLFEIALAFKLTGGVLAALVICALAPFSDTIWSTKGVVVPMLVAAVIPVAQSPENVAASAIILRGRYDVRSWFLAISMGLRLIGLAIGSRYGVIGAVLGIAVAQVLGTAAISVVGISAFRRFPVAPAEPLHEDVRALRRFLFSSTLASSLDSARGTLGTTLVPTVAPIAQAGYFSVAQAPQTGLDVASSPARLVLLTEQTRDYEAGRHDRVFGMLGRYIRVTAALMVVAVPLFWWLMPFLIGLCYGHAFRVHATSAARLVLLAAALRFVWGWAKSFPVSIGRPGLRVIVQSVEIAVFVPLLLVFASRWGATGAAGAMLVSTVVFCAIWTVVILRVHGEHRAAQVARVKATP